MTLFVVGQESAHHVGDPRCLQCREDYPVPCPCGGLIHAAEGADVDPDGNPVLVTQCDRCGRPEDAEPS